MSFQSYAAIEATEKVAEDWRAKGFTVTLEPRTFAGLEEVFKYYKPDLIAVKGDEKLAIEVKSKGAVRQSSVAAQLSKVVELFKHYPDWKFLVVYYGEAEQELPSIPLHQLQGELEQADLIARIDPRLALLNLWSITEALVRRLYASATQRPQSPGRLVELLAGEGNILPDQADHLRSMVLKRNKFIHGDRTISVSLEDLEKMVVILKDLLPQLPITTDYV